MRRILGFMVTLAVVAASPSVLKAQAGPLTVKSAIAKPSSDCDASCQLMSRLNALATRLDDAEKEITHLKTAAAQNENQTAVNSLKIIGLEGNMKTEIDNRDTQASNEDKKMSAAEQKLGEYAFRLTSLE